MTIPHQQFPILVIVACVIGASAGAPDGFTASVLLTIAACWSVVTLWTRRADRWAFVAVAQRPIEVTR
jgi:hypothetical protein